MQNCNNDLGSALQWKVLRDVLLIIAVIGQLPVATLADDSGNHANPKRLSFQTDVNYGDSSEAMHRADLYFPALRDQSQKLPPVLMIHGGAWTAGDKSYDRVHARALASRGYWVMVANYRLAPKHKYPAQLDDCRRALAWIQEHAEEHGLDMDRLGVWGYSAGGHLAALVSLHSVKGSPQPKACVSGGTPFDLTSLPPDSKILERVFGGTPRKLPMVYEQASPVTHVDEYSPPMFLFHGTKDWLVPEQSSLKMQAQLSKHSVEHEYLQVEGKGHLATFADPSAMEKSFDFLDRHLKADSTWRNDSIQSK